MLTRPALGLLFHSFLNQQSDWLSNDSFSEVIILLMLGTIMHGLSFLRRFSSKSIPIHLSNASVDTTKLHDVNQRLHEKLGPIYKEKLGPDVEAVWIADPR